MLVSIIIPNFNREKLITETLNSVKVQTYSNWEALIVDDGSTDQSIKIIQEFIKNDSRFKLIKREREPKGAPTCRNIGVESAKGDFIIFLDSDDLLAPDCLKRRVSYCVQNPDLDFIVFQMLLFHKSVNDLNILGNIDTKESDLYRFLRGDVVWGIFQPIWKSDSLKKLSGFDESLKCWQEYDLHLRALIKGLKYIKKFDIEPDCFCRHHIYESIGKSGKKNVDYVLSQERVLMNIIKDAHSVGNGFKLNVRVQLMNVCFNYANIGYHDNAKKLLGFAKEKELFSTSQNYKLSLILTLYKYSLQNLKGFYRLRSILTNDISLTSQHLKVKYLPKGNNE